MLNLVYNIVIYNEFSHCLLYNSSHFSLLLGRVFNVHSSKKLIVTEVEDVLH